MPGRLLPQPCVPICYIKMLQRLFWEHVELLGVSHYHCDVLLNILKFKKEGSFSMNQVLQLPFDPCSFSPWLFLPGCWEGRCSGGMHSHGTLWCERDDLHHNKRGVNKLQAPYALCFTCSWWGPQHPRRRPLLCVCVCARAHFQHAAQHLHQPKVIYIHSYRNSKQVPWFL